MTHIQEEILQLKASLLDMVSLASKQLQKSIESLLTHNISLAQEVIKTERRLNAMELNIDRDCENIMALYNPVAVDLRLVFAIFKINAHLERIGDYAEGISRFVVDLKTKFPTEVLNKLEFNLMAETALEMMALNKEALVLDNAVTAREVFEKDLLLDRINYAASGIIAKEITGNNGNVESLLDLLSIIRKIERVGDMSTNIAEETIFYIEAKVLKHQKIEEKT